MTTYTRPITSGTPTTGQTVEAAHVNEPVDQIYDTILAGGITADQIAAGAVNTTELATAAVTAAKMDGTLPDASAMTTSTAPTTDAQLANKKFVDDQRKKYSGNTTPDPQSGSAFTYAGEESITFGSGLIIKQGSEAVGVGATNTVTFAAPFSNACLGVFLTHTSITSGTMHSMSAHTLTAADFQLYNASTSDTFSWLAIGH